MKQKIKESDIQRSILDYLEILEKQGRCYCFRSGAGAMKLENGRYFKTGKKGCPDITCVANGKFIGLECKTPTGKLSEAQNEAKRAITKAGGIYNVVTSIDEVVLIMRNI